jgi:sulfoxide reductase heme-binding subunit YedZ
MLTSPGIYKNYTAKHPRLTNQAIMAFITVIGCVIAAIFAQPNQAIFETFSVGTGYVGLLLIFATLVIGPLNMLKVRKNPVNLNLRRDIGIWAGITSLAHVVFAAVLQISWGDSLLGFFLNANGSIKLDLFGVSDYFGLIGALVVLLLLVISNNYFLKKLKGKSWKNLQRFNYLLFVVAVAHTLTQQINSERGLVLILGAIILTAGVVVAQLVGFSIYRSRSQMRKTAPGTSSKPGPAYSNRTNNPYNKAPKQQGSSFAMIALVAVAGSIAIFFGFEIGHLGASLIKHANNTENVSSVNNNNSSSSSNQTQVNSPSFSQPVVRSRHS